MVTKIVFLGDATVGKTSIAFRISNDTFDPYRDSTIGAQFIVKEYEGNVYNIWDTAGQERYLSLIRLYYRDADIVIMVFDIMNNCSLERFDYYLERISENQKKTRIIYVGNKLDLIDETDHDYIMNNFKEMIKSKTSSRFKNITNDYIFVSAKTGQNIDILLKKIHETAEIIKAGNLHDNKIDQKLLLETVERNKTNFSNCTSC